MENLSDRKKLFIMLAIMSAMLFASLNQTIIGTALPKIISDLGGMHLYSWVFTIFMLASSVTAVLAGKLSDIYGRKPFILIGIGVFSIGSMMCGFSNSLIQLIVFRGIQGFGAGMIMSTAFTAVGDLFSPRERGRWQGIMSSVFGLSSVLGPTFGGWIVDHSDWHWVFWVFLPFGAVAFLMIWKLFPSQQRSVHQAVDYMGSVLITFIIVPLLLAFTWGGNEYGWGSMPIITLLAGTAIFLFIFILVERKVENPVLPLHLFKNGVFTISNILGFLLGAGMFGTIMYMPMFIQGVMGGSATKSGMFMMSMTLSMVAASAVIGQLITKTGKYKFFALSGLLIMGIGTFLLSFMSFDASALRTVLNLLIVGIGLGIAFPVFTLTIQNAVPHHYLGVATASAQLFRQMGGTIGVAIMGTFLNHSMKTHLVSGAKSSSGILNMPADLRERIFQIQDPQILMDHSRLSQLLATIPHEYKQIVDQLILSVREALDNGLTHVFLISTLILGAALFITFFLNEIPLRTSNQPSHPSSKSKAEGGR